MSKAVLLPPVPLPDEVSQPFWDGCRRKELLMQRCASCQRFRFHPREMCPHCRSMDVEWRPVSGRGLIFSKVVCHPPVLPAFQDRVPYAVVLVELEEDPNLRLVGNVLDVPPDQVRIGLPVHVVFQEISEAITLPQWRLA